MSSIGTVEGPLVGLRSGTAVQDETAVPAVVPALADGVELLGEVMGSGYRRRPALVRRADGQTVQLTPLLYHLLDAIDGVRDTGELAGNVGERIGRDVGADDVEYLLETKLRPLGLLRQSDGTQPLVAKQNPLLTLRPRLVVSNPELSTRIAAPFAPLFRPSVVAAFLVAFAATTWWIAVEKGLASAAYQALYQPDALLLVFGLTLLSSGFHELGHAAACRYSGARPGTMGVGLYLVWPAFYTDVSDSYRLSRGGRLRVDLGGLYFNAIFGVAILALWWAIGWDALLLVIAVQLLQMLRQLVPVVRFDGYHVLADLTGVPDLFMHIGPTLRGLLPTRRGRSEARALKWWARAVVTGWVLIVVPLLTAVLAGLVLVFPRIAATAWDSLGLQWATLETHWARADMAAVAVSLLSMLTIFLPVLGIVYLVARLVRSTVRRTWRATAGRPLRRAAVVLVGASLTAFVVWAWWPEGQYRPLEPTATWTFSDLRPAAAQLAVAPAPPAAPPPAPAAAPAAEPERAVAAPAGRWEIVLMPRRAAEAQAAETMPSLLAPKALPLPSGPLVDAHPVPFDPLSLPEAPAEVVPTTESTPAPRNRGAWPFPWAPPRAPKEGDNQVVAVNTTDGATTSDTALALVWVTDGDRVEQRNEAWALASCIGCRTRAVAFQIVLVIGYSDVVIPVNTAVAVNYECESCSTEALAVQLVVTLSREPSPETRAEIEAIWAELEQKSASFDLRPLVEVYAELRATEALVIAALARDDGTETTVETDVETAASTEETVAAGDEPAETEPPTTATAPAPEPESAPTPAPPPEPTTTSTAIEEGQATQPPPDEESCAAETAPETAPETSPGTEAGTAEAAVAECDVPAEEPATSSTTTADEEAAEPPPPAPEEPPATTTGP